MKQGLADLVPAGCKEIGLAFLLFGLAGSRLTGNAAAKGEGVTDLPMCPIELRSHVAVKGRLAGPTRKEAGHMRAVMALKNDSETGTETGTPSCSESHPLM